MADELKTIPQLARDFGVTDRQADYAARQAQIQPTRRVGIIRLFDTRAAQKIKTAIGEISRRPGVSQ